MLVLCFYLGCGNVFEKKLQAVALNSSWYGFQTECANVSKWRPDENGRSMNAEIIHRLEQTFSVDDAIITNDVADTPKELAVQLVEER